MGKIIRRTLTALLIVILALSAAIVGAKIQMYTATGEDYANEVESQDIAKLRARDKAIKKATKQAGVYLKTYSRSVNSELTDDEVTAITSNAWQLVSEPKYSSKIVKGSDETSIIIWTATVEVNVDDSEIQSWIKRDDKDKSTIITQTREAQKASEENERKIEDLREKYKRATTQAEKDSLRKQMSDAERDFLANQKLEEGYKLSYAGNYSEAIKFYDEALILKPDYAEAYNNRGFSYFNLRQHERAIQDYDKAIELNPNFAEAYNNRGTAYDELEYYEQAIQDYDKAIEIDPKNSWYYYSRALFYSLTGNNELAIKDYSKAIELDQEFSILYYMRAINYEIIGNYDLALENYSKSIELNPCSLYYEGRARFYRYSIKNYNESINDYTKAIELKPKYGWYYKDRGDCYQELGEEAKAQADFAKAKELGYKG